MEKKLFKVTFEAYVVAEDTRNAESIAKDIKLTIQDDSVRPTLVVESLNSDIVDIAEKLVKTMLNCVDSKVATTALKAMLTELGYTLNKDEIDALYSHCEFMYLHEEVE